MYGGMYHTLCAESVGTTVPYPHADMHPHCRWTTFAMVLCYVTQ